MQVVVQACTNITGVEEWHLKSLFFCHNLEAINFKLDTIMGLQSKIKTTHSTYFVLKLTLV